MEAVEGWARVTASPEAVVTEAEGAAGGLTLSLGRGNGDTQTRLNARESFKKGKRADCHLPKARRTPSGKGQAPLSLSLKDVAGKAPPAQRPRAGPGAQR